MIILEETSWLKNESKPLENSYFIASHNGTTVDDSLTTLTVVAVVTIVEVEAMEKAIIDKEEAKIMDMVKDEVVVDNYSGLCHITHISSGLIWCSQISISSGAPHHEIYVLQRLVRTRQQVIQINNLVSLVWSISPSWDRSDAPPSSYAPTNIQATIAYFLLSPPDDQWYMDAGATSHMVENGGNLTSYFNIINNIIVSSG